jgi:hypothetical protein
LKKIIFFVFYLLFFTDDNIKMAKKCIRIKRAAAVQQTEHSDEETRSDIYYDNGSDSQVEPIEYDTNVLEVSAVDTEQHLVEPVIFKEEVEAQPDSVDIFTQKVRDIIKVRNQKFDKVSEPVKEESKPLPNTSRTPLPSSRLTAAPSSRRL